MNKDNQPFEIVAPMHGVLIPIEKVPDPAFAQKMVGDGVSIDPLEGVLRAPCDGEIIYIHKSFHAITIEAKCGIEILLHIGIDTVTLKGEGFEPVVKIGDKVNVGDVLINFDLKLVAEKAPYLLTQILVSTMDLVEKIEVESEGDVQKGAKLFTIFPTQNAGTEAVGISGDKISSKPITIINAVGLHARPASVLVALAKDFKSNIELSLGDKVANAKSVTSLMKLDSSHGDMVVLCASGDDARAALDKIVPEIEKGLGDENCKEVSNDKQSLEEDISIDDVSSLQGIAASTGLAIGEIYIVKEEIFDIPKTGKGVDLEKADFEKAIKEVKDDLQKQFKQMQYSNPSQAEIFKAHLELLEDPDLHEQFHSILTSNTSAASAWQQSYQQQTEELLKLESPVLAERAMDLRDVGKRVMRVLLNVKEPDTNFPKGCIIAAEELSPSVIANLNPENVYGFCTTTGGATSHVAILARGLGIPAIVGINKALLNLNNGTNVILDGNKGLLQINPDLDYVAKIEEERKEAKIQRDKDLAVCLESAKTKDGVVVEVVGNIGKVDAAKLIPDLGGEGVGLLRSEFLFLNRATAPTEDEQFKSYKDVAKCFSDKEKVVIRTLDVGGDKPLSYLPLAVEENPFLGERGIRVCLNKPDLFKTQLRALLRASEHGFINIMFPMISDMDELREAKKILDEERLSLGIKNVAVGMMIEVPSAAILAEQFATEVDFFSIGTNDLTQYTMAIDRGHPTMGPKSDGLHPAVLRMIKLTVDAAHKHGKWAGVCGGLGSDPKAVPILIGLGVDELSVDVPAIPTVKAQIRTLSMKDCQILANKALNVATAKEVRSLT